MKNPCRDIAEFLSDYDDATLEASARERVSVHLAECPTCRAALERQRSLVGKLKENVNRLEPKSPVFRLPEAVLRQQASSPTIQAEGGLWSFLQQWGFGRLVLVPVGTMLIGFFLLRSLFGPHGLWSERQPGTVTLGQSQVRLVQGSLHGFDERQTIVRETAILEAACRYRCASSSTIEFAGGSLEAAEQAIIGISAAHELRLENGQAEIRFAPAGSMGAAFTPVARLAGQHARASLRVTDGVTIVVVRSGMIDVTSPQGNLAIASGSAALIAAATPLRAISATEGQDLLDAVTFSAQPGAVGNTAPSAANGEESPRTTPLMDASGQAGTLSAILASESAADGVSVATTLDSGIAGPAITASAPTAAGALPVATSSANQTGANVPADDPGSVSGAADGLPSDILAPDDILLQD